LPLVFDRLGASTAEVRIARVDGRLLDRGMSRIADVAGPDEVLATDESAGQVEGLDVEWSEVGPIELQGLAEPVVLFRAIPRKK
jgi:hypothetical protein